MKIVYTNESLITSGGTLFISGNDGNNNVIQNGTSATVLDRLIARAGTGSTGHILRIFERDDSTKVNFYTYTLLQAKTSPTNTDANFTGLTYIGGTGNSTFSKPCLGLEIVGANGTSGVAGSSGSSGSSGIAGSSGSSGSAGTSGNGTSGTSGISTINARAVTRFTATASQTTFNVNYTVGQVDVYYNGSKLDDAEFTASNGTSVVLNTGVTVGSIINIIAWSTGGGIGLGSASTTTCPK
jgi:hypothetical protein